MHVSPAIGAPCAARVAGGVGASGVAPQRAWQPAVALWPCRARRSLAVQASGDGEGEPSDGSTTAQEERPAARVFASRAAKTAPPRPPPVERRQDGAAPSGAQAPAAAPERRFGRFARDASGNFARPEGTPVQPEGDRQQRPWGGDQPGGGRSSGAGDRPGVGRDGRPGGGLGGRGPGGGFRNGDRDAKGRKGRSDEPQLFGKAATEARRNARASRKEERDAKSTKKERAEFVELPPRGLSVEELAEQLAVNSSEVIKALFMKGIMTTVNQVCNPFLACL
jgi:hypothetical protein